MLQEQPIDWANEICITFSDIGRLDRRTQVVGGKHVSPVVRFVVGQTFPCHVYRYSSQSPFSRYAHLITVSDAKLIRKEYFGAARVKVFVTNTFQDTGRVFDLADVGDMIELCTMIGCDMAAEISLLAAIQVNDVGLFDRTLDAVSVDAPYRVRWVDPILSAAMDREARSAHCHPFIGLIFMFYGTKIVFAVDAQLVSSLVRGSLRDRFLVVDRIIGLSRSEKLEVGKTSSGADIIDVMLRDKFRRVGIPADETRILAKVQECYDCGLFVRDGFAVNARDFKAIILRQDAVLVDWIVRAHEAGILTVPDSDYDLTAVYVQGNGGDHDYSESYRHGRAPVIDGTMNDQGVFAALLRLYTHSGIGLIVIKQILDANEGLPIGRSLKLTARTSERLVDALPEVMCDD